MKQRRFIYETIKITMVLISMAFLLSVTAVVYADERLEPPVLLSMPEGNYDFYYRPRFFRSTQGLETVTPAVLGEEGQWKIEEEEGSLYRFNLYNVDSIVNNTYNLKGIYTQQEYSDSGTFTYVIREPGMYYLFCDIKDEEGNVNQINKRFTVDEREGAETVSSRVSEIVAECSSETSGEYETALWLHDWVVTHSYYDTSGCYHGADSILFYGTGVCDSYTKLYKLLLQEAGIECMIMSGNHHAWNAAKIDGEWCQIDPTWDDPVSVDDVISGSENHLYFGLNDELMSYNHVYEPSVSCISLNNCAVKKEKTYDIWFSHIWEDIENAFLNGTIDCDIDTRGIIRAGGNSYYSDESYVTFCSAIAAAVMSQLEWDYQGGRRVSAAFVYDSGRKCLSYSLNMKGDFVVLPHELKVVGEDAFQNAESITGVKLPEQVEAIKDGAFSGCSSLMWIVVCSDDIEMTENAFQGVPDGYAIVSNPGSNAEQFAIDHGIAHRALEGI